ncbi:hypothetical protein ACFXDE_01695 [Kitasatospora sp. NPDC059408]|uniref:hypothetical protein n=1 Tax=Kitasatospora sp. NPDC059408 TaxID=3346823 RepID=UPI0036841531
MRTQTCRRHPSAGRFMAVCSGCTQELYDIQARNQEMTDAREVLASTTFTVYDARTTSTGGCTYLTVASRSNDVFRVDVLRRPTYAETRIDLPNPVPWDSWIPVEQVSTRDGAEHEAQFADAVDRAGPDPACIALA